MQTTAIISIVAGMLIGCTTSTEKIDRQSSGTTRATSADPSSRRELKNTVYSTQPFAVKTGNLPSRYWGVNLEQLSRPLLDLQVKSFKNEFETTEQQRERVRQLKSNVLLGPLTLHSVYAFSFEPDFSEYDADRQVLKVIFSTNYCCLYLHDYVGSDEAFRWTAYVTNENRYPAKNAFGVERTVDSHNVNWYGLVVQNLRDFRVQKRNGFSQLTFKIHIAPIEAKALKMNLRILLLCELHTPFLSLQQLKTSAPTIKNPVDETTDYSFVHVRLLQARTYDVNSGIVYSTLSRESAQ